MTSDNLKKLKQKIEKFQNNVNNKGDVVSNVVGDNLSAFSIATDLVGIFAVCTVIGVFLDKTFNSRPVYLIIFLILGFVTSGKNIWMKMNKK